jgi:glucokinase
MILAGDIGGTHTRLAFFENAHGNLRLVVDREYPSRNHAGLSEIVSMFLRESPGEVDFACFGVAGPVLNGQVSTPNLAWLVDSSALSKLLNLEAVWLINDVEAQANGLGELRSEDFMQLNPKAPSNPGDPVGNAALIAPGTGLGEAGLHWDGTSYHPFASEGGHADFAPRTELEIDLLRYLTAKFKRVSYERVLSGPGLLNIYSFLRDSGMEQEPGWLTGELAQSSDAARTITQNALAAKAAICERTLEVFVAVLGAEAGNVALRFIATGGVFIAGGIAPKILPALQQPEFAAAFVTKGRLRPMLEGVPVSVALNGKSGLIGAARYAMLTSGHHAQNTLPPSPAA